MYELMGVLFFGLSLILTALTIQFVVWRIRLPRNQTKTLLVIFIGTFLVGIMLLWGFARDIRFFGISPPVAVYEYLQLGFLYVSLSLGYTATYSALEVDSPSLVIIMAIAAEADKGLDEASLRESMNDEILLVPRINDLISGKLAYLDGEVYRLTRKGGCVARALTAYRKLLRKAQKGG